ncbi:MAG: hypothetical protein WDO68_22150 [Gammaproteobacteria bacterium]
MEANKNKKRKITYWILGTLLLVILGSAAFKWAFMTVGSSHDSLPPHLRAQSEQKAQELRARGEPTTQGEQAEQEGRKPFAMPDQGGSSQ